MNDLFPPVFKLCRFGVEGPYKESIADANSSSSIGDEGDFDRSFSGLSFDDFLLFDERKSLRNDLDDVCCCWSSVDVEEVDVLVVGEFFSFFKSLPLPLLLNSFVISPL